MIVDVYVGVGSNIAKESNVPSGLAALAARFGELRVSAIYESRAYGFEGDNFYNLVAGFATGDDVYAVSSALQDIEAQHGRVRNGQRFLSRTLDLDLLLYGDQSLSQASLTLPRAGLLEQAFMLLPLAEIAGHQRHPLNGLTYSQLWAAFDKTGQELWRVLDAPGFGHTDHLPL